MGFGAERVVQQRAAGAEDVWTFGRKTDGRLGGRRVHPLVGDRSGDKDAGVVERLDLSVVNRRRGARPDEIGEVDRGDVVLDVVVQDPLQRELDRVLAVQAIGAEVVKQRVLDNPLIPLAMAGRVGVCDQDAGHARAVGRGLIAGDRVAFRWERVGIVIAIIVDVDDLGALDAGRAVAAQRRMPVINSLIDHANIEAAAREPGIVGHDLVLTEQNGPGAPGRGGHQAALFKRLKWTKRRNLRGLFHCFHNEYRALKLPVSRVFLGGWGTIAQAH